MEYTLFVEELLQYSRLVYRVDSSSVKTVANAVRTPQCAVLHPIASSAFLKLSKLFPVADHLALRFLQCINIETANKIVSNNPKAAAIDQQISQLMKYGGDYGSVERYHSLIGTYIKSVDTHPTSKGITPPRSQVFPLPNSNIVSGSYDHNGGIITSEDGIKLTVPKGAIKDGDVVTLSTVSELYGPFVLPSKLQVDVVSPYYWIGVSGSYHFQKPVQVEFEHFAAVTACDPSHYQLLCCKDDDESYTMQLFDYDLSFTVQNHIALCTFQTHHFCVYCLSHNHEEPVINRIGAYFLKPKNFKNLNQFTVEIWFSFPSSKCVKRNEELFTKKGMILDTECSYIFEEASSDESSTNCFTLSYNRNINGWHVNHKDSIIETKKVNFYNYFTEKEELKQHEERSLFPPRFTVNIRNTEHTNATNLDLNVIVTLCDSIKERTSLQTTTMNLVIPLPVTAIEDSTGGSRQNSFSIGYHVCDKNTATLPDLIKYSKSITHHWKEIAIQMDIHKEKVDKIDLDYLCIQDKCHAMLGAWFESTTLPCWCKFIQALCTSGLESVAEEAKRHLMVLESTGVKVDEGNSKVI